jgi:hypothetical protein
MNSVIRVIFVFLLTTTLLTVSNSNAENNPLIKISPDNFPIIPSTASPATSSKLLAIRSRIGKNSYVRIGDFYPNIEDVYADFQLNPNHIMSCDRRHDQALLGSHPEMKARARNYFCLAPTQADIAAAAASGKVLEDFNTNFCRLNQKKQVYLGYCLDKDDTLDWVALQSALLNADENPPNTTIVKIPNGRLGTNPDGSLKLRGFVINQQLVIPSDTKMEWEGESTTWNGRAFVLENPSYIRFQQLKLPGYNGPEPIDNRRGLGYSLGTVFALSNMPFLYSGNSAGGKPNVTEKIQIWHPYIDAGNYVGENGISFAQGVRDIDVIGGHIRNVKIHGLCEEEKLENERIVLTACAGGKAIQCEAGCMGINIEGISISDSHIGINSNAFVNFESSAKELPFMSQIRVDGVSMRNVDVPVNVANDYCEFPNVNCDHLRVGTQRVRIANVLIRNSGRIPDSVWPERRHDARPATLYSTQRITGTLLSPLRPAARQAEAKSYDNGIVTSRGGYDVLLDNITFQNNVDENGAPYGGIDQFYSGHGYSSAIRNLTYTVKINCALNQFIPNCN